MLIIIPGRRFGPETIDCCSPVLVHALSYLADQITEYKYATRTIKFCVAGHWTWHLDKVN
jgi:hypothetical protein